MLRYFTFWNRGAGWQRLRKSLIHIEGLTKVFYTDEIETHALSRGAPVDCTR